MSNIYIYIYNITLRHVCIFATQILFRWLDHLIKCGHTFCHCCSQVQKCYRMLIQLTVSVITYCYRICYLYVYVDFVNVTVTSHTQSYIFTLSQHFVLAPYNKLSHKINRCIHNPSTYQMSVPKYQ